MEGFGPGTSAVRAGLERVRTILFEHQLLKELSESYSVLIIVRIFGLSGIKQAHRGFRIVNIASRAPCVASQDTLCIERVSSSSAASFQVMLKYVL